MSSLISELRKQNDKLAELEERTKCSSLVVHGIPSPNGTELELGSKVTTHIFEKRLGTKHTSP